MTNAIETHTHISHPIDSDRRHYRRAFQITFLFFLLIAAIGRLLPRSWRAGASGGRHESLVEEAQRTANTVLPFVFIR